jgi:hypothetical protein
LRELLLDKLIDLFHGGFKASLGCTRDMEIQGRVLFPRSRQAELENGQRGEE